MNIFLKNLILFSLMMGAGVYCWNSFMPISYKISEAWLVLIFFIVTTGLFHRILVKAGEKSYQHVVRRFLLSTVAKFFLYLVSIIFYILFNKSKALPFVIFFMTMYFFFTVFEIVNLLSHFKNPERTKQ